MKEIKFNSEATESVLKGINIVADAVKSTYGPNGRNVIIDIDNDGIHEVFMKSQYGQMGCGKEWLSIYWKNLPEPALSLDIVNTISVKIPSADT